MSPRADASRTGERAAALAAGDAGALAAALAIAPVDPTGVHEARKSVRRLRSLLAMGRRVLGRDAVDAIDDELRALARDLSALREAPDEDAVAAISAVPGIGPWTAQVHLLFGFERPDVFPMGDVALAAGLAHLKGLPERPAQKTLVAMARAWSPWRSLAARLLWHHWRHATGRPAGEAA